jgi:hypothetical protein
MYDRNTDTASYSSEFGGLYIDFAAQSIEDDLDHDAIWEASGEDYPTQQHLYQQIAEETLDDDRDGDYFGYGMDYTDFGVVVENGDQFRLIFDATSVRFV